MPKTNTHAGVKSMLVFSLLAFSAFAGAVALANDSEDQNSESSSEDSVSESTKKAEEKAQEATKKQAERQREAAKQQLERNREAAKQQLERTRETNKQQSELSKKAAELDDDVSDDTLAENEDGNSGDNKGMFKERAKTLEKLQEELAQAKENILEKQAEGANVTSALARLALAEAGLTKVGSSFDTNNLEEAKRLAKQIKKEAHFTEKDLEFAKKVGEETAKVEKRFGQVEKKIASLEALGGDVSTYKSQLASLRSDFAALKASIAAAPGATTRDTVKDFERRVKRLKSMVESAIFALGGKDDDDLSSDHEEDSNDLSEDLDDVAEVEDGDDNGVSGKVRKIAAEHKAAAKAVQASLADIKKRDGLLGTLIGSDSDALDTLNKEVMAQNVRAAKLELESKRISDPDTKQILDDQISVLKQEATKLQSFITSQSEKNGIFGWLTAFIPRF